MKWIAYLTVFILLIAFGYVFFKGERIREERRPGPKVQPEEIKVGMVTDVGGLGDQSFNDAAYKGLKRARDKLGIKIKVIESSDMTSYVPNLTSLAEQDYDLVWAIGVLMQDALATVAEDLPDTNFGIVDAVVDKDNVYSATFKEEEGSFLCGVVAGMMTKSNKIGFVGGMDLPTIRKFEAGYRAGIKAVNPDAELIVTYTGVFDDPNKGKEQALALFGRGVDVVYHASGACGVGVIKAAQEQDKYAIGVDMPQSHLAPDHVLTSMIKRVDLAVYEGAKLIKEGNFKGGTHKVYGLKEGGVGLEEDQLKKMTPKEVQDKVEEMRRKIINGEIKVPTTREDSEDFTL
ncbi:BMP family ABC transporter substrate-binding protein [Anoxybacter fermentans]|uniref:BMP family ABC transporter substrate-binding protein n=1 Tax=Anoxybacter fermentans TaxID=1323375 RepID=A0A3Q9HT41_9FIRM|nr:BMP family ABC transporter substrate-binding protein [Anoxybacter fermentans]